MEKKRKQTSRNLHSRTLVAHFFCSLQLCPLWICQPSAESEAKHTEENE